MPADLRYGRLVWATVKDRNGFRKSRPGVILTPTDEITENSPLVIVAVTTTFRDPPPSDHVLLPWHPTGRVVTKLTWRSAAVISWLETAYTDEVESFGGVVPAEVMRKIEAQV
jgi:mRNA-degrading endonuclease toxin of MazEF toxin-antitoxin module